MPEAAVPAALAFPLAGERVRLESGDGATGAIVKLPGGGAVGRFTLRDEGDALTIWEIEIEPSARGYGLGSEAARLLREAAQEAGWRLLRARSHPSLGLSVYFWTRMGLHPLGGEGPEGGLWFERRLSGDA